MADVKDERTILLADTVVEYLTVHSRLASGLEGSISVCYSAPTVPTAKARWLVVGHGTAE